MGAPPPAIAARGVGLGALAERLRRVRAASEALIAPLEPEDLCLQGMADASPPKWHLGHTTWFFSTFVLEPHAARLLPGDPGAWQPPDQRWGYLFNSYYETVGCRQPRPQRGLLTRPPIGAVLAWRQRVDDALAALVASLERCGDDALERELAALLELGLQHEQQHQELLLMDLLDGFARQPLAPAYRLDGDGPEARWWQLCGGVAAEPRRWLSFSGGLVEIGHPSPPPGALRPDGDGPARAELPDEAFHFDNEAPRHRQWLEPFELASTLVRNAEMEAFIAAGGYHRPELWMSEGWAVVQQRGWQAPRYWRGAQEFTLAGLQPRDPEAPVRHLSWFEADAFARWAGARLPSEAEWEHAAASGVLPEAFGLLWQWTASPYRPYPGFLPAPGAVGEYNGKFMTSQFVLRGSCFLTPEGHARLPYRNFYPPASRWMAAGLRLAR
jgi:formylglycine-generating enzyme required for sulfatase activity